MRQWMRWCVVLVAAWGSTASASASAKQYGKAPAEVIHWPLPWAGGASLEYDEDRERVLEYKGVGTRTTSRSVTRIWTLRQEGEGFVQGWTTLAVLEREVAASEVERQVARQMEDAFGTMTLEVRLAADGTYAAIANLAPIRSRLQQLVDGWVKQFAGTPKGRNAGASADQAVQQRLLTTYASLAMLEGQLSLLPRTYNFVAGGGVGLDHEYVYDDLGANPVGGDPFPMNGRFTLRRDELHQGWLMMEWSTAIDRVKGGPILAATARKLLGAEYVARSGKELSDLLEQAANDLDIGSSTRFRIDPVTGIVQWMQLVQRRRIGDRNDVRTTTLQLRSRPWVAPPPGAGAAAADAVR